MQLIEPVDDGIVLRVKVVPGARRTQIAGVLGDRLKVQLAAPPQAGQANRALIALLARQLEIPRQQIVLIAGHTQPHKTLRITGLTAQDVRSRLL
jgi:hypothetical protein